MVQAPSKTLTLAEFPQLPKTKPATEYIDGQIIQKPMPQGKHNAIQGEFVPAINGVVKPKRIAHAFPELELGEVVWQRLEKLDTSIVKIGNSFMMT